MMNSSYHNSSVPRPSSSVQCSTLYSLQTSYNLDVVWTLVELEAAVVWTLVELEAAVAVTALLFSCLNQQTKLLVRSSRDVKHSQ